MAEIVNLRQARKAKNKQAKEAAAQANRVAFGRTKSERTLASARKSIETKRLDGHNLTVPEDKT